MTSNSAGAVIKLPCVFTHETKETSVSKWWQDTFFFVSLFFFPFKCYNLWQEMCEFNTKITIVQLLRLTIVSAKSEIYSLRPGYFSPGNSVVLEIAAASLFISITNSGRFWGSFCWNSSKLPTDLFIFVIYACTMGILAPRTLLQP